jgi:hypothetical protein
VVWEDLGCSEDCEYACSIEAAIWQHLRSLAWSLTQKKKSLLHNAHVTTLLAVCVSVHHRTPSIWRTASNAIPPVNPLCHHKLNFYILCTCICWYQGGTSGVDMCAKVWRWRSEGNWGIWFPLPLSGSKGLNSGHLVWQQVSFPAEPSCWL